MSAQRRDDVDAVVLVGGKGTRLRPLTLSAPKPMLPTAGVPFLTHLLSRIKAAGVDHVILGTSYQAEVFSEYFGDGASLGLDLEYVIETEPLGTGGAIGNVAHLLRGSTAMIFNGDVLSGCDLSALLARHERAQADVTLHLTKVSDPRAFGCVPTDPDGRVTGFLEKDPDPVTDQINAGTYVFTREVVESIPVGRPVSVERETFPQLLESGAMLVGYVDSTYWRDLGKPSDFAAGSADLVRGLAPSAVLAGRTGEALVLEGCAIAPDATLTGGTTVGRGCTVGSGAVVIGSVLFDGAVVAAGARITDSIVGTDARIGEGSVLCDVVIGDRARIGRNVELLAGARVWPEVELPDGGVRFSADR
ncbi:NDP-sugar synthase [Jatrophihabitans telluris]|uniref:NDP-sugar synthase n=1 Tax=Jatrophihabitans telluris TaxID=2038343 RepID=A0ABY4QVS5_9ACTN|nr:NDP-sugar synthase [Jatrophihabitans telluris]UQX87548.1 NDP-sugar synthase [Jatrophihabitans telluris]